MELECWQAAACEDNLGALGLIRERLEGAFHDQKLPIVVDAYSDPRMLLKAVGDGRRYDLFFLDIDMPGLNGIELCRRLRADGSRALVVFISGKEELVFQTFEVQPFRFVRKNHFQEELPQLAGLAAGCPHVRLRGLMAIPPVSTLPGANRRYFSEMRNLFVDIMKKMSDNQSVMDCLSMGMSADYEDAIAEGATLVRVGTALFGPRPPHEPRPLTAPCP